jgi:hypothetical protein
VPQVAEARGLRLKEILRPRIRRPFTRAGRRHHANCQCCWHHKDFDVIIVDPLYKVLTIKDENDNAGMATRMSHWTR